MSYPDGGNTFRYLDTFGSPQYEGTSATFTVSLSSGSGIEWMNPTAEMMKRSFFTNPTTQPHKHIAKCTHCGVSSMIPEKTDKIMALICPQCGSPLDA